ncbi:MAG: c-type cytochrome [Thiotrichales bacterium]|nr:c-type cytochrome [Thiotrichales bacterium]
MIRSWPTAVALLLLPLMAGAFPWDEDMRDQPSIKAQESQVQTSADSVPVQGEEPMPPPADTTELVHARLRAGEMPNPVPKSGGSVNRGKRIYDIHCATCHGDHGEGDGPVGKKFVPDPMNLTLDYVQIQPDGQIFYTISHGSIAMPGYRDAITIRDRWHLINYIKAALGTRRP